MGGGFYNTSDRLTRSSVKGYSSVTSATMDSVFEQKKLRKIHNDMNPVNITNYREARDSKDHPFTVPVQLYLDVTGSMMEIPVQLIKDGLPKLISTAIQRGVPDIALMFGAIGDHECDNAPLQLGQFESADEPLDMWLERVWPEAGGGGNAGESYGLAWYNAANFIETDAWDKRKEKGYVFTIGDEPALTSYPTSMLKALYGNNPKVSGDQVSHYSLDELYRKASERNHIFHIHVEHNGRKVGNLAQILGENHLVVKDHKDIPLLIVDTIMSIEGKKSKDSQNTSSDKVQDTKDKKEEGPGKILL